VRRRRMILGIAVAAVTLAVLAAAGGAAYAVSSSGSTITVCVRHHGGALYRAHRCASHDAKLSWNARGPQGTNGTQGLQGLHGSTGSMGATGLAGPITGTLPSGVTLRGWFGLASPPTTVAFQPISFGLQLASPPTVHAIANGGPVPAGCSGTASNPGADPGNLCIFVALAVNVNVLEVNPLTGVNGQATTFGGVMEFGVINPAISFISYGTWAVTG
jgi:hypothetical protein